MSILRLSFLLFLLYLFIYFFFSQKETAEESCGHTIPWEKGWILVAPTITCTAPGEKSPEQAVLISHKGARSSAPKELKFKVILHVPFILWASLQSAFSESSISCLDFASELCQGFGQNKAGSGYFFCTLSLIAWFLPANCSWVPTECRQDQPSALSRFRDLIKVRR